MATGISVSIFILSPLLQLLAGPPPRKSLGRPVRSGTRRLKPQSVAGALLFLLSFAGGRFCHMETLSGGSGMGAHPVVLAYSEQVNFKMELT